MTNILFGTQLEYFSTLILSILGRAIYSTNLYQMLF